MVVFLSKIITVFSMLFSVFLLLLLHHFDFYVIHIIALSVKFLTNVIKASKQLLVNKSN